MAGPFSLIGQYDQTNAGNRFCGYLATAAAVPVNNTTSPTACLWNRAGASVKLVLERISFSWVATTEAPGGMLLNQLQASGSAPGTGLPLTAFTAAVLNTSVFCTKLGGQNSQPTGSFGTAATLTTAGVPFMTLGMSHLTTTGTATFGSFTYDYFFYDSVIVMPGTFIYPTASAATASTYNVSMWWRELPVND